MSNYPEANSLIRNNAEVLLDMLNYATKKELDHTVGVDRSNLAATSDFITLKVLTS